MAKRRATKSGAADVASKRKVGHTLRYEGYADTWSWEVIVTQEEPTTELQASGWAPSRKEAERLIAVWSKHMPRHTVS